MAILSISLIFLIVPTLIIPVSYMLIVKRVKNSSHLSGRFQSDERVSKLMMMVMIIIMVFIACWAPFFIVVIYEKITGNIINAELYQARVFLLYYQLIQLIWESMNGYCFYWRIVSLIRASTRPRTRYTVIVPIKRPLIKRHITQKNEMPLCLLIFSKR